MQDVENSNIDPRDEVIRQQAERIRALEEEIVALKELLEKKADSAPSSLSMTGTACPGAFAFHSRSHFK